MVSTIFFGQQARKGGLTKEERDLVLQEASKLNLPHNISFQEKLYMLRKGIGSIPLCLNCGSPVRFHVSTTKYVEYCSRKCSATSDSTQNKKRKTNTQKYGNQNAANVNRDEKAKLYFSIRFKQLENIKDRAIPLFTEKDWKGGLSSTKYPWKCTRCNHCFESKLKNGYPRCPTCDAMYTDIETMVKAILDKKNIIYQPHNRKIIGKEKREIDFYIPDLRLAIEVHGLWYHTETFFPPSYHQEKAQICQKKGIKLIQIFSDELENKKDLVESKICFLLNQTTHKVGARKCKILQISKHEAAEFLKENHLQGNDNSSIKYGAFFETKLVGVMTFCKPRVALGHKKTNEGIWELSRFCTSKDCSYPGLFSKMIKTFIVAFKPLEIISYGDGRWTHPTDNVYVKSGFEYNGTSKPNYYYLEKGKRLHRFNFRKSILVKKYPHLAHLSEREIMHRLNYKRIYDAGHHRFALKVG